MCERTDRCVLCGSVYARVLTRTRAAELFAVKLLLIRRTWTQVKCWHVDHAAAGGPEDVLESAEDSESGFGVRIQ